MLDVVNKYGGYFYFQIFYGTIVMLGLMFLVALLVLSHIINPGAKCERGFWDFLDLHEECWSSLVSVKLPLSVYDITGIISNCLIILLAMLSVIAAYKRKKIIIYAAGCLIILAALVMMIYTLVMISLHAENRATPTSNSSDTSREVHNQLIDSLYAYKDGDPAVTNAWKKIMQKGCCCGVDGYRNFLEIGEEIPEYCSCRVSNNYLYIDGSPFYKCNSPSYLYFECDLDSKYNVTSKGCMKFVLDQVQKDQRHLRIMKIKTFVYVSSSQFTLVILAMMFTSRGLHVPTQNDCSGSVSGSKLVPLPEPEDTKDDASVGAV